MQLLEANREIMWNISHAWVMYLLALIAVSIFSYGIWRKISFWRRGKSAEERWSDFGRRFLVMLKEIFLQRRTRQEAWPGVFHSLIFYSFIMLVVTTSILALDCDFGTSLFKGPLYVFLSFGSEVAGLLILVGVGMAAWRRYVNRPSYLENVFDDAWALILLSLMVLTGFLVEGQRIAVAGDPYKWVSPVGTALSVLLPGMGAQGGKTAHSILWWTHTVLAMGWIATIPYTKFVHLISLPTNVFFPKLESPGTLKREDIDAMMEGSDFDEESFNVGTERTADFTWKELLSFDACISCGRCEDVCPATQANQPFSPKEFIASLKVLVHKDDGKANGKDANPGGGSGSTVVVGNAFDEDYLWYCRTCMACMEVCPAMIEHVDTIINIRRNEVVMQGRMPADAARAMRLLETQGNPFGPEENRIDWIKNLDVRVVGPGEKCDVIYWVGCCTTFDPTKQRIANDLCTLLKRCGIEFGVLGADERCCGDPARLIGQEHLFQTIAKQQIEDINKREFRVLMVSCPHCYNVLKNEYPQFGGHYNVVHHSEFLHEMLWSGKLSPIKGEKNRIVYHDPCYLGRYQKIYDSPREVLKAIPGSEVVEMKNHAAMSLCCGGGGGNYWFDNIKGERLNNRRVGQARDAKADTIVTACAYCMQMLDDSVKEMGLEDSMKVKDLATVLLESLEDEARDAPTDEAGKEEYASLNGG